MPARPAPAYYNRARIALLLTAQWLLGAAASFAFQGLLVYVVLWRLLPAFGLNVLDLARSLATADYPGTLLIWPLTGHAP